MPNDSHVGIVRIYSTNEASFYSNRSRYSRGDRVLVVCLRNLLHLREKGKEILKESSGARKEGGEIRPLFPGVHFGVRLKHGLVRLLVLDGVVLG